MCITRELHKIEFIRKLTAVLCCGYLWVKGCIFYASNHILSYLRESHSSLLKKDWQFHMKYDAELSLVLQNDNCNTQMK